jgi:prevent-host-death family protein
MAKKIRVAAADFKANCLRLIDQVAQRRTPIVIIKRGKPVAKLVPLEAQAIDIFGRMAGTIKICGDIIGPIENLEWTGDEDSIRHLKAAGDDPSTVQRTGVSMTPRGKPICKTVEIR